MLSSANIEYLKWDMNRPLTEVFSQRQNALPTPVVIPLPCDSQLDGRTIAYEPRAAAVATPVWQSETSHRFVLGLYELQARITAAFPHVLLENCSSGGGRFDPGILLSTHIINTPQHHPHQTSPLNTPCRYAVFLPADLVLRQHGRPRAHEDPVRHLAGLSREMHRGAHQVREIACSKMPDPSTLFNTYSIIFANPNPPLPIVCRTIGTCRQWSTQSHHGKLHSSSHPRLRGYVRHLRVRDGHNRAVNS